MKRIDLPDKLEFNLEISFTNLGEFVFKEIVLERKTEKPSKKPAAIYVFPKSTAAIAEL